MMVTLALRTLRDRAASFAASFASMFLGAVIVMSFGAMYDTGVADGVSHSDKQALTTMSAVVGSIALILVGLSVVTTLTLAVSQRHREMALLKTVGATPRQISRMVVGEALTLSVAAALLAIPVSIGTGAALLAGLRHGHQVSAGVDFHYGFYAVGIGVAVVVLSSAIAARITARRATRVAAAEAIRAAAVEPARMSKKRIVLGIVFLLIGIECAVMTATLLKDSGFGTTQAMAGEAAIQTSIGLAVLSPLLVRGFATLVARLAAVGTGASGHLAALNIRQRAREKAGTLIPIMVFTALATATLYVQAIDNRLHTGNGLTDDERFTQTMNYVVVGMLSVFTAIVLVNALIAATSYRRREFGQQRLAGSTPGQVLRMVGLESMALVVVGVAFGTLAGLLAVVPYSIARADRVVPDVTVATYLGIVGTVVVLGLGATIGAARRAVAPAPILAVAA